MVTKVFVLLRHLYELYLKISINQTFRIMKCIWNVCILFGGHCTFNIHIAQLSLSLIQRKIMALSVSHDPREMPYEMDVCKCQKALLSTCSFMKSMCREHSLPGGSHARTYGCYSVTNGTVRWLAEKNTPTFPCPSIPLSVIWVHISIYLCRMALNVCSFISADKLNGKSSMVEYVRQPIPENTPAGLNKWMWRIQIQNPMTWRKIL